MYIHIIYTYIHIYIYIYIPYIYIYTNVGSSKGRSFSDREGEKVFGDRKGEGGGASIRCGTIASVLVAVRPLSLR